LATAALVTLPPLRSKNRVSSTAKRLWQLLPLPLLLGRALLLPLPPP
jgi:hypothetical protein